MKKLSRTFLGVSLLGLTVGVFNIGNPEFSGLGLAFGAIFYGLSLITRMFEIFDEEEVATRSNPAAAQTDLISSGSFAETHKEMTRTKILAGQIGLLLCLAFLCGCVGVVGDGYVGGPGYVDVGVPGPDVFVFGGYGRGGHDREASHRGAFSRGPVGHAAPARGGGGGGRHR